MLLWAFDEVVLCRPWRWRSLFLFHVLPLCSVSADSALMMLPLLPTGHYHGSEGIEIAGTQSHRLLHDGSRRRREVADGPSGSFETHVSNTFSPPIFFPLFFFFIPSRQSFLISLRHDISLMARILFNQPLGGTLRATLPPPIRCLSSRWSSLPKPKACSLLRTRSWDGLFYVRLLWLPR